MSRGRSIFAYAVSALALYALSIAAVAMVSWRVADDKTSALLKYAVDDARTSFEDAVDQILDHIGSSIVRDLKTAKPIEYSNVVDMARARDLDELNIVRADGLIVGTSDPTVNEKPANMNDGEKSREFQCLVGGNPRVYSQQFRRGVHNPERVRKYFGVAFPDGSGYIQMGYDEKRFATDFDIRFAGMFKGWDIGEDGFYICARMSDDVIVADADGRELLGKKLDDIGLAADTLPLSGREFMRVVMGRRCRCLETIYGRHRIIACVPWTEFHLQTLFVTATTAVVLLAVFATFGALIVRIRLTQAKLDDMRKAEYRRLAADLATAKTIQMSALPMVFPPFPSCLQIGLHATIDTAKEVGGDFYDYYFVAHDRLAVLIADVSGKGIPAAMFMMKAKSIIKGCVSSRGDIAAAMSEANAMLSQYNEAEMFVTAWIGVLNVRTGALEYVNAGHNPPYIRRADGTLETLDGVSGLFLAGMDDTRYSHFETRLAKGDLLYLFTDGVTEANDSSGAMFGESRLEGIIRRATPDTEKVCADVRSAVSGFVGIAPRFDDMTMLALYYRGNPVTEELTVKAELASMAPVAEFVERHLAGCDAPDDVRAEVMVAVDEISTNIVSYSGSPDMTVRYELADNPRVVRITFIDSGKPWNPLRHDDPDITLAAEDRAIGGLGILMVKKLMDDVSYEFRDGRNILAFRKRLPWVAQTEK